MTSLNEFLVRDFLLLAASDVVISGRFEWSELLQKFIQYSIFQDFNVEADFKYSNPEVLTRRQYQLLILIALGKSNLEISSMLKISDSTVKVHLSRLYKKLNVKSRMQAVVIGRRIGYISI